jgi:hypothetical protein
VLSLGVSRAKMCELNIEGSFSEGKLLLRHRDVVPVVDTSRLIKIEGPKLIKLVVN